MKQLNVGNISAGALVSSPPENAPSPITTDVSRRKGGFRFFGKLYRLVFFCQDGYGGRSLRQDLQAIFNIPDDFEAAIPLSQRKGDGTYQYFPYVTTAFDTQQSVKSLSRLLAFWIIVQNESLCLIIAEGAAHDSIRIHDYFNSCGSSRVSMYLLRHANMFFRTK